MNKRTLELTKQAGLKVESFMTNPPKPFQILGSTEQFEKFAELMVAEFSDVVKTTANELAEFYTKQGCSEEEVMMRVNGALVVLGHIRERFKD